MYLAIAIYGAIVVAVQDARAQRSESLRIPSGGDNCNVVNLNFGGREENAETERGPQGPPGKRGIPGIQGMKGERGEKGEVGPQGVRSEINIRDVTSAVLKAIGVSDCDELMKIHGATESGYFVMRSNVSRHPVYNYCDFELRRGTHVCHQIIESQGTEFKKGYYLTQENDDSEPSFVFCENSTPENCSAVSRSDAKISNVTGGVFDIYPSGGKVEVYCDLETDGGGWIVMQRRMDGSLDFFRDWNDYVNGFGQKDKEFWLGLESIHQMTKDGNYELRIDLTDWEGESVYAKYGSFSLGPASDNYRIKVGSFSGTAGDSFASYNMNKEFSTKDRGSGQGCARGWKGAWWYGSCSHSNLNGLYEQPSGNPHLGVVWYKWKNAYEKLKFTEMKFRRKE